MDTDSRRFVIDTDCGLDDSLALVIALSKLNIDAITCVAGNVEISKVVVNVSKVLQVCDVKIPIYRGASEPIIRDINVCPEYHGDDGLGENPDIIAMEGFKDCINEEIHASQYLAERAKEGNLNLICLGPLTNIALAMCLNPEFHEKVDSIFIMGGTVDGKGNYEPNTEYNFATDPEAAFKVFKKFKNIHLVPWECCPEFEIPKEKYDLMCDPQFPKTDFVRKSHHHQIKRLGYMYICDGFTSLIAIDPTLCEYTVKLQAKILIGSEAAGQITYYWPGYIKCNPDKINCRVYKNFKLDETMDLLLECLRK